MASVSAAVDKFGTDLEKGVLTPSAGVVKTCGKEAACYLDATTKSTNQSDKMQFVGIKAAYMLGVYGNDKVRDQLLKLEVGVLKHMIRGRRSAPIQGMNSTSDIAQEAVLGLLKTKKSPSFADPGALRGYLWRSAWHLLVKAYEQRQSQPPRIDFEEALAADGLFKSVKSFQNIDSTERAMAIGLAMNLLSKEDRELFRRVYFENQDVTSAGAAIGLGRGTASSRLSRARGLLATRLADWSDVIG